MTGALTVGSALLDSQAQSKAAQLIAQGYDAATAAQMAMYERSRQDQLPTVALGQGAAPKLANLLGYDIGTTPAGAEYGSGVATTNAGPDWNGYLQANPDVMQGFNALRPEDRAWLQKQGYSPDAAGYAQYHYATYGQKEGRQLPTVGGTQSGGAITPQPVATGSGVPTTSAQGGSVLDQLMSQAYAQPAFDAGVKAVQQSSYATGKTGGGVLKELMDYGTRFGSDLRQNEVNNLLAAQGLGSSAASSLASAGANAATNAGQFMTNAANARGSGYAQNPWATGLGATAGWLTGDSGSSAIDKLNEWWRNRSGSGAAAYG